MKRILIYLVPVILTFILFIIFSVSGAFASTLVSFATGDWLDATTWELVDATSYLDSEAGNTEVAVAASWGSSQTFAPGAITIDGIGVKLYSRTATPGAYTLTIRLYNTTDSVEVAGTSVTVNVSDLPTCSSGAANNEGGWFLVDFGSVVLEAAHNYRVEAQESNASADVYLWRDGTASNWSRILRTTTTQSPAATDVLHVMGEHTGAGTGNSYTVTMDAVAAGALDYGSGTDASTAVTVNKRGTLNYGIAGATNYYLKLSGNLIVYNGGTFTIGTTGGNEIPRDSTAVLEFDPVADGGMGLIARNGSTVTMQGLSRTTAKSVVSCKLNTDEAINQTNLGVDTDTGWLDNDEIAVASTTRTYSQCEKGAMAADAGAAQLTVDGFGGVGGGLAYAHSGTAPTQAEVILLTRNVKVRSATSTLMTYFSIKLSSTVDIDWVEFYYLGEAATDKYGINIETITGSCSIQYSSIHDTEDYGLYTVGATSNNYILAYNVMWNISSVSGNFINIVYSTGTSVSVSNNIVMYSPYSSCTGIYCGNLLGTIDNNIVVGVRYYGYYTAGTQVINSFSGNTVHSCSSDGLYISGACSGTISSFTAWRNNSYGISFYAYINALTLTSPVLFGNNSANIFSQYVISYVLFQSGTFNGDTGYTTSYGLSVNSGGGYYVFDSCDFGTVIGDGRIAHNTADIYAPAYYSNIYLNNTILATSTEVSSQSSMVTTSSIYSQKHDQIANPNAIHKTWKKYGTIVTDRTYFNTATPSQSLTPNNATYKLESGSKKAAIANGNTATVSVYVRKSDVGHGGADYNGNHPRLIVKKNVGAGIASDTVLDTMTAGLDTWEQLSGTTDAVTDDAVLEFVVDCDGTTGFINIDDWSDPPTVEDPQGERYWFNGLPGDGILKEVNNAEKYWGNGLPGTFLFPAAGTNITNAPDNYAFSFVAASAEPTTGLDHFTMTNTSAFAINVTISGTDMTNGVAWTLADDAIPLADTVGFKAGLDGGAYNIIVRKNVVFNELKHDLGAGNTQKWGLKMYAPTSFSDGVAKTGTITLTAAAH